MSDGVILMYHRIADVRCDPWALAVTPQLFREHLRAAASAFDVVPLAEATTPTRRRPPRLVFTFDDGYEDNLAAARALASAGFPATYFVVSGAIGGASFWWDDLTRLMLEQEEIPSTVELEVAGVRLDLDLRSEVDLRSEATPVGGSPEWRADRPPVTPRQSSYLRAYTVLRPLDQDRRAELLRALALALGLPAASEAETRPLGLTELLSLSSLERAEIGAHTVTHPALSDLDPARQEGEMRGSKRQLEEIVGRPITSFAYPHGTRSDYGPATIALAEQLGFHRACTAVGGLIDSTTPRFELPRVMVENWDGDEFERRVRSVLTSAE
jgi:peptidoglycan/xylan/chitin deacetylase (PgdA/CDA1 family)